MATPSLGRAERSDRRFVRRWGLIALFLLAFPYLVLALLTGAVSPGGTYSGMLFNPADTFLYLSQVLHSHLGEWAFTDYFTYLHEPPLALFALYTVIGKLLLVPATPLTEAIAFHAARLALAALFIQQAWRLYGELLVGRAVRRLSLMFVLFTSGLGLYQAVGAAVLGADLGHFRIPFDLDFIESSSFYGLLYAPHFAAVLLLVVVYLRALHHASSVESGGWRATAAGVASSAALATIHPEKIGVLGLCTVLYLAALQVQGRGGARRWLQGLLMVGGGVPYTVFALLLTIGDKQIVELLRQGRPHLPPPDPWFYYPLGYGIPGLLALAGLPQLVRRFRDAPRGVLLLWSMVLASLVILLAPWQALDHRAEAMQVAVAGLAARSLVREVLPRLWRTRLFRAAARRRFLGYRRRRLRLLSINLVLIFSSVTVLYLAFGTIRGTLTDTVELYLNRDDPTALAWMQDHVGRDQVVLTGPYTAQFVAAYGGTHVVWGEWAFTPDYYAEGARLAKFFRGDTNRAEYLRSHGVQWIYFGPREANLDPSLDPASLPGVSGVYRTGATTIYRVGAP